MMERILEPEYMDTEDEASSYDAIDHALPNGAFVDRLAALGARGKLLDVGCGPGQMPLMVVERIEDTRVVGVDAAKTMLRIAEERRRQSPLGERVRYEQVDAKRMPFPDAAFDGVYSNTVLHHIPEPRSFLSECARTLKPGGVLLIRDLFRPESPEKVRELVELHAAKDSQMQKDLFAASLHAALTPKELGDLAREAGLEDFEITIDSDRHMSLQIAAT